MQLQFKKLRFVVPLRTFSFPIKSVNQLFKSNQDFLSLNFSSLLSNCKYLSYLFFYKIEEVKIEVDSTV